VNYTILIKIKQGRKSKIELHLQVLYYKGYKG